eukprot:766340-Hanusia_phi.AAC.4
MPVRQLGDRNSCSHLVIQEGDTEGGEDEREKRTRGRGGEGRGEAEEGRKRSGERSERKGHKEKKGRGGNDEITRREDLLEQFSPRSYSSDDFLQP